MKKLMRLPRNYFIFFVIPFIFSLHVSAQNTFTLSGKIVEEQSGLPVPFSSVVLYKDHVLILGTDSDFDGLFNFSNIEMGKYEVEVSFLGYQTIRKSIIISKQNEILELQLAKEQWACCGLTFNIRNPSLIDLENTTSGQTIIMSDRFKR